MYVGVCNGGSKKEETKRGRKKGREGEEVGKRGRERGVVLGWKMSTYHARKQTPDLRADDPWWLTTTR